MKYSSIAWKMEKSWRVERWNEYSWKKEIKTSSVCDKDIKKEEEKSAVTQSSIKILLPTLQIRRQEKCWKIFVTSYGF